MNSSRTYCINVSYNELIDQAQSHLETCCDIKYKYKCIRHSESEFLVTRNLEKYPYENVNHIPRFIRVRKVNIFNGKLICDCTLRKTFGLVCPHIIHVKRLSDEYFFPSFRDVSCIWWKLYSAITQFSDSEKYIRYFRILRKKKLLESI